MSPLNSMVTPGHPWDSHAAEVAYQEHVAWAEQDPLTDRLAEYPTFSSTNKNKSGQGLKLYCTAFTAITSKEHVTSVSVLRTQAIIVEVATFQLPSLRETGP